MNSEKFIVETNYIKLNSRDSFEKRSNQLKKQIINQKSNIWCKIYFLYKEKNNQINDDIYISIHIINKIKFYLWIELSLSKDFDKLQELKQSLWWVLKHVYFSWIIDEEELEWEKNIDWILVKSWWEIYFIYEEEWKFIKQKFDFEKYIKVILLTIFESLWDWIERILVWKTKTFINESHLHNKNL